MKKLGNIFGIMWFSKKLYTPDLYFSLLTKTIYSTLVIAKLTVCPNFDRCEINVFSNKKIKAVVNFQRFHIVVTFPLVKRKRPDLPTRPSIGIKSYSKVFSIGLFKWNITHFSQIIFYELLNCHSEKLIRLFLFCFHYYKQIANFFHPAAANPKANKRNFCSILLYFSIPYVFMALLG